ncbi:uncharacterized protein [Leptinotarsa decemlineata]|uniref:uncharacterized protein n=1 Tax=Leptinotarsa decemlineata TaxID=7539 RepID=UPI003D309662
MDETWINAGHTTPKVWVDETVTSSRRAFLDGLSTGLTNPSGKRKRLIICHIGNENGFVAEGLWCFESKKTGDYQEEMNGESFEQWFSKVLPHLEDNAVIVMDNAPYYSRRLEKIPTTSSKKVEIQNWLPSKNISFEDSMLRVQLLKIVKERKLEYQKYIVDEIAAGQNKIVLPLPPYHCELNSIELIWADVKNFVAQHNTTFKFADLKVLFDEALKRVTAEKWEKCVLHVISEVETKMWKLDNIIEAQIEPLIIQIGEDDTTDEETNSSS